MKTYDPSQVAIVIGTAIVESWNEVDIEFEEDFFNFSTGTTGESTRSKNANRLCTFTLRVPQTSEDNAKLTIIETAGSTVEAVITDTSGTSKHVMPQATIVRSPNVSYANESGEIEWVIKGDVALPVVGGN